MIAPPGSARKGLLRGKRPGARRRLAARPRSRLGDPSGDGCGIGDSCGIFDRRHHGFVSRII